MKKTNLTRRLCAALLALGLLAASGCGQDAPAPSQADIPQPLSADMKELTKDTDLAEAEAITGLLAEGVNRFGLSFFAKTDGTKNQFFSPYSICCALSILHLGAGSTARDQLETVLGITDPRQWDEQMKLYMEKEWPQNTKLLTANSLWISPLLNRAENIETDFLAPSLFYYQGEMFEADFADPRTAQEISAWVEQKTGGMIPDYQTASDAVTVMAILNAVYFEGKWEQPFQGEDTKPDGWFKDAAGNLQKNIPIMYQYGVRLRYFETDAFKGVELPYKDSALAMDILLPAENASVSGVSDYRSLSPEEQEALWQSFDQADFQVIDTLGLPAFTMDITVDGMQEILEDMGLTDIFREDTDLDKIGEGTFVSSVSHRAKIEVDEEGTRAAAVTEIATKDGAAIALNTIDFVANRPFVYVIRDTETGMILFMGQVVAMPE